MPAHNSRRRNSTGAIVSVASTGIVRTPLGNAVALSPSLLGRAPAPPQWKITVLQLGTLGRLLFLAVDRQSEALLGVVLALAPFGLLARRGAQALAIGRRFARLGRGFGALVGDGRGGRSGGVPSSLDFLLQNRWIGQSGE